MRTKTLSQYPLLIGEVLRRSELRRLRKERRKKFGELAHRALQSNLQFGFFMNWLGTRKG